MSQPKALSARTVRKYLVALPDWQAVGGNRELVSRLRPPDLPSAVLAAATALLLAKVWGGHAQVESCGVELVVRFTTPTAGGVTRTDLGLAALFSKNQSRSWIWKP
jgi:pterin-4a-carbinolamine dehydratase